MIAPQKRRFRIATGEIEFVSLCPRGKNGIAVVYKEGGKAQIEFATLTKEMNERGEVLACIYPPNLADADGHFAEPPAIRDLAHSFARKGFKVDIRHGKETLPRDQAYMAESFIIQKEDPRFSDWKDEGGKTLDLAGGWGGLFKIESEQLRALYRAGDWKGVSLFGDVLLEPVAAEASKSADTAAGGAMDETKLAELLKSTLTTVAKEFGDAVKSGLESVKAEIAKALPKPEEKNAEEPKDKPFDPLDPVQVKAKLEALKREQVAKEVDWDDADSVEEYFKSLLPAPKTRKVAKSNLSPEASYLSDDSKAAADEMVAFINGPVTVGKE